MQLKLFLFGLLLSLPLFTFGQSESLQLEKQTDGSYVLKQVNYSEPLDSIAIIQQYAQVVFKSNTLLANSKLIVANEKQIVLSLRELKIGESS